MKKIRIIPASIVAVLAALLLFFACGKETFIVSAIPDDPSQGSVSGGGEYKNGDQATLKATPYSGYLFSKWNDGMTENPRSVIVHENVSLKAYFSKVPYYTINVTSNNTSWGTVSGGGTYASGSTVTIKATPKSGYSFEKWNDGNTSATRTITVTGNATYKAYFKTSGGGDNTASMTVNFGGTTWTASSFIGAYWANDGDYVIGGRTDDVYPWFRIQLKNISVGTYHASLDTTSSWYWLNNNVNIVQYYESTYLTVGDDTYQYGEWQGWDLTVTISSLTSNTISFTISGYMYNALEATCTSCPEYVGSFAAATKRYITVSANNIPFTTQSKANGSNTMEELIIAPLGLGQVTSPQK